MTKEEIYNFCEWVVKNNYWQRDGFGFGVRYEDINNRGTYYTFDEIYKKYLADKNIEEMTRKRVLDKLIDEQVKSYMENPNDLKESIRNGRGGLTELNDVELQERYFNIFDKQVKITKK